MSDIRRFIKTTIDILEGAEDFYEKNQDTIDSIIGPREQTGERVDLKEGEPLLDAQKEDDKVLISAETNAENVGEIGFGLNVDDYSLVIDLERGKVNVKLPKDSKPEKLSTELNNGVLTVVIPREQPEIKEIEPDTDEEDEE